MGFSGRRAFRELPYVKDINRLITSLYLKGQVIFQDDFEASTLAWGKILSGGTGHGSVSRDTTYPHRGNACMKLDTTGALNAEYVDAILDFGIPPNSQIGIEAKIALANANFQFVTMEILTFNGVKQSQCALAYRKTGQTWQYVDSTGSYVSLPDSPYLSQERHMGDHLTYCPIGLKGHLANLKYIEASAAYKKWNLKGITNYNLDLTLYPNTLNIVFCIVATGVANQMYVDDVIVTCSEPA